MPEQVAVFGGAGGVGHAGAGLPGRSIGDRGGGGEMYVQHSSRRKTRRPTRPGRSIGDRGGGGEMYVQHSTRVAEGKRAGLSSRSIGDRGGWGDKI